MAGHTGKYPRGPRRLTAGLFPRKRWGRGRLVPLGPGPPQRAIQRRHLVPGAAGGWWAFLKARTGAHYVDSNHMGAQAARLSVLRSAYAAASLSLCAEVPGSAGSQAPRRPDSELTEAQLSARGWALHHQHLQCGWARAGGGGAGKEGVCIREGGGSERLPSLLSTWGCLAAQPGRSG